MNSLADHYTLLQPKLYSYFLMKTSNVTAAEDLTQDVFYEASKGIHQFKGDAALSTWLFAIARNLLSKYYRSKKYEKGLLEALQQQPSARTQLTEQYIEMKEDFYLLQNEINTLEDVAREIVLLRLYGELSFQDIGALIGKSENYARVTFFRAKQKIVKGMEGML